MPSPTAFDQLVGGRPAGRRLQRHVGHALQGHVAGRVGEGAPVGAAEPLPGRHAPVELVADEDAVADQVPGLGCDPLVVQADRGQAVLDRSVPGDVHDRGAVLQGAELVEGGERRPRVRRLVAEGPVQLGGVADGLVDGEPQVGRVDHQVVVAGLDRGGGHLLGQQLGERGQLGVPVPPGAGQVLPAPSGRRGEGAHGLERAGVGVDRHRRGARVDPHPLLHRRGPGQVGVELVSPARPGRRRRRGRRRGARAGPRSRPGAARRALAAATSKGLCS